MVREAGEVEEKVIIHELIAQVSREMRNLSTAGGLRYMLRFPVLRPLTDDRKDVPGRDEKPPGMV
jgi:hypothetical protein